MIDTSLINGYVVIPVIMACFLIGYVIKHYTRIENRYIPLWMMIIGVISNILITLSSENNNIGAITIIAGGVSGLASTGVYELLETTIFPKDKKNPPEYTQEKIGENVTVEDSDENEEDVE